VAILPVAGGSAGGREHPARPDPSAASGGCGVNLRAGGIFMSNATDPRDKPHAPEPPAETSEQERREMEKKRRELDERLEREKYQRDDM
jgi:hypothetical protein